MVSLSALQSTCSVCIGSRRRDDRWAAMESIDEAKRSWGAQSTAAACADFSAHPPCGLLLPRRDRLLVSCVLEAGLISAQRSGVEGVVAGTSAARMGAFQSGVRRYRDLCATRCDAELGRRAAAPAGFCSVRCRRFAPLSSEPDSRREVSRLTSTAAVDRGALPEFIKSQPQG